MQTNTYIQTVVKNFSRNREREPSTLYTLATFLDIECESLCYNRSAGKARCTDHYGKLDM